MIASVFHVDPRFLAIVIRIALLAWAPSCYYIFQTGCLMPNNYDVPAGQSTTQFKCPTSECKFLCTPQGIVLVPGECLEEFRAEFWMSALMIAYWVPTWVPSWVSSECPTEWPGEVLGKCLVSAKVSALVSSRISSLLNRTEWCTAVDVSRVIYLFLPSTQQMLQQDSSQIQRLHFCVSTVVHCNKIIIKKSSIHWYLELSLRVRWNA